MTTTLPSYGLTDRGFVAARAADFLATMRSAAEAYAGRPLDWSPRNPLSNLYAIASDLLGQVSASGMEASYNARIRANARGQALDDLGVLCRVPRLAAAPSTAPAVLTGTAGTVIPLGRVVERVADRSRWIVAQDTTIGGGGTAATVLRAVLDGPRVAFAADAFAVVTPVSGWSSVALTDDAAPGRDVELDGPYRLRQAESLQVAGVRSMSGTLARLRALKDPGATTPFLLAAVGQDNDGDDATINGIAMQGGSVAFILYPSTLTTAQSAQVARTLLDEGLTGIRFEGSVAWTATGTDRAPKVVRWSYAADVNVAIAFVLTLEAGYVLADVSPYLSDLVVAYAATWTVGSRVSLLDLYGLAGRVEGIRGAAVTINGSAADFVATLAQVPRMASPPSIG